MVVLLVLLMFAVFLTVDWAVQRARGPAVQLAPSPALAPALVEAMPAAEPVFVAGYQLPEALHYHQGHTWARVVGPDTVVVGVDDFARQLTGRADAVALPAAGSFVEQGGAAFRIGRNGRTADVVSPVEGEVVETNRALAENPALVADDPYGRGWLVKLRSSKLASNLRNLLSGTLARRWTEEARAELELRLMALSGSVLQDGGAPAADFADHLDPEEWKRLTATFLLT
jgi:glycine cleavage system H protein